MADLPYATIKVRKALTGDPGGTCDVMINGEAVAHLPVSNVRWEYDANDRTPRMILTLLAEDAAVDSIKVGNAP